MVRSLLRLACWKGFLMPGCAFVFLVVTRENLQDYREIGIFK